MPDSFCVLNKSIYNDRWVWAPPPSVHTQFTDPLPRTGTNLMRGIALTICFSNLHGYSLSQLQLQLPLSVRARIRI